MNEVKGFIYLKNDADLSTAMHSETLFKEEEILKEKKEIWLGKHLRCLEINKNSKSALVVSSDSTKMAMFDLTSASSYFECHIEGDVICPPELDIIGRLAYFTKAMSRNGGYNRIVAQLVVAASLHKGEFNDAFLWR